ncbi:MAG TPA: J domain-containing protein [Candidatus Obscuribacterales bacterium]
MARKPNHYQVLGVDPSVSTQDIKRAYRRLVKDVHPDVDYADQSKRERERATEHMMRLNEAYETLKDTRRRAEYDSSIGANGRGRRATKLHFDPNDTEEAREQFLRHVFNPSRQNIVRILSKYAQQLRKLSLDIYDDELVAEFEHYVDEIENTLRKSSEALSGHVPSSLDGAVQMMRYAIAQAVDGLEETRRFCQNYDYDHLAMAGNLFKIATDLTRKALQLTK